MLDEMSALYVSGCESLFLFFSVGCRWVYAVKVNQVDRLKAHLVAKWYAQIF